MDICVNVALMLGIYDAVYLIKIYNSQEACCNKRQGKELAEYAGVYGACQFTKMAMTMMVYAFVALILKKTVSIMYV